MRDCVAVKGILPCVGCVGIVDAKLDRSSAGVHSSVVELTILAILPFHCLNSVINPTVFGLAEFWYVFGYVWAWRSLVPCGKHAQLGGGSGAERLIIPLAYGWVERCNDIASCGTTHLHDKCSLVFYVLNLAMYLFNELLWAYWMIEWDFLLFYIIALCIYICLLFQCIYDYVHGARSMVI